VAQALLPVFLIPLALLSELGALLSISSSLRTFAPSAPLRYLFSLFILTALGGSENI